MEQRGGCEGGLQPRYEVKAKRPLRKKQCYAFTSSAGGEVKVGDDVRKEGIIGGGERCSSCEGSFAELVEHDGPYHDQTSVLWVGGVRRDQVVKFLQLLWVKICW